MTASGGYTRGEDDHVCLIRAGHGVVSAAGDEPQARVRDVAVDEPGGELCLGIRGDSIDGEGDCGAVGPGDDDAVPGLEVGKVGEHSGYAAPVDVAGITEGPTSPGTGEPVYQPAVMASVGTSRVPSFVRPSLTRVEFTPIAGILMRVGASRMVA